MIKQSLESFFKFSCFYTEEKQVTSKHNKEEHIENNESPDYHMGNLMNQLLSLRESNRKFASFTDEQLIKGTG